MGPGDEIVTIVDENNQPIGTAPRRKMRAERRGDRWTGFRCPGFYNGRFSIS